MEQCGFSVAAEFFDSAARSSDDALHKYSDWPLTFEHQPVEAAVVVKHDAIRISERMHPLHYSVTSQASGIRAVCMMRATQHCDPRDCAASANGGCVTSVEESGRKREIAQPPLTRWCPPLACVKGLIRKTHRSCFRCSAEV